MLFRRNTLFALTVTSFLSACQSTPEKIVSEKPQPKAETQSVSSIEKTAVTKPEQHQQPDIKASTDLWQLTRDKMSLPSYLEQKRVLTQLNWYKKHPHYMQRVLKRAEPYFYYIHQQAVSRQIPIELALLPIVESAFDPFAYSHGRAAGAWQFIPSTGKYFGLKQTWWYDGRRDITRSTDAAFTYLQQLNKRFDGDWLLALAAYNAGGGNVSRAIKRNRKKGLATDYWSLKLPEETMRYVPKLLAVVELIKNAENYQLEIPQLANKPYFKEVEVGSQLDLAQAANLAGVTTKEIYLLNPALNRWATDPEGPHSLLVPIDKAEVFSAKLAELPENQRMQWSRYTIKSGDSLSVIADRFNTTTALIKQHNKLNGNSIRVGKTLMIPNASANSSNYVLSANQRHIKQQKSIARSTQHKQQSYVVKSGDSFWSISQHFKIGVRQLARWNNMAPGDPLQVGKHLVVWLKPDQPILSNNERQVIRKVGYKVRNGDSLSRIASKFNLRINDILRWNKLDSSAYLQPGQQLTLYVDVTRSN